MQEKNVKHALPFIMLIFISSATMISVFNIISPQLIIDFGIDTTTVSLLSMIAMLMMGVASVVYSTLSDYISVRKLMITGVILLNAGAVLSFIFSGINFYLLLFSVALMIFGGTCGSGLMIITVTKYISQKYHSKYYGYNTACVAISQGVGILLGGFFATYIGWRYIFIIPLLSLIAVPTISKYLPDEKNKEKGKLDIIGLGLLTCFTIFISLYFNFSKLLFLVIALVVLILFFIYITKAKNAFINITFFKNKNFVIVILLVAIAFGLQTAFSFLFPFLTQGIYELPLDKVSMILLPSYLFAAIAGINSGKIVEKIGGFKTLVSSLCLGIIALIFTALLMDKSIILLCIGACLFSSAFALLYAPFMQLVISTLNKNQIGVGIGFFNLMTSIGPSLMIVLTGKMMGIESLESHLSIISSKAAIFSNILAIFSLLLVLVIIVLLIIQKSLSGKENSDEPENVEK